MLDRIPHLGPLLSTWRGRLIVFVVVSQLLIPLTYYAHRRDPHDERFAWRMFSPIRMAKCTPDIRVDGKRLDPYTEFHEGWIEMAKRGRFRVVEEMARHLCREKAEVIIKLSCEYLGQKEPVVYGGFNMCVADEI